MLCASHIVILDAKYAKFVHAGDIVVATTMIGFLQNKVFEKKKNNNKYGKRFEKKTVELGMPKGLKQVVDVQCSALLYP